MPTFSSFCTEISWLMFAVASFCELKCSYISRARISLLQGDAYSCIACIGSSCLMCAAVTFDKLICFQRGIPSVCNTCIGMSVTATFYKLMCARWRIPAFCISCVKIFCMMSAAATLCEVRYTRRRIPTLCTSFCHNHLWPDVCCFL